MRPSTATGRHLHEIVCSRLIVDVPARRRANGIVLTEIGFDNNSPQYQRKSSSHLADHPAPGGVNGRVLFSLPGRI